MTSSSETPHHRWRRRRLLILLAPVAAFALVWIERRPIVDHFIDRELAGAGVPAHYTIADLGLGRQRLRNVAIGDPADPDLTADWIETEVGFGLSGPYLAGVAAGNVRIKAALRDGRITLGAIDRLLPPPSGKPFALPSLPVQVGRTRVDLTTPYGPVRIALAGQGRLDDGFRGPLAIVAPSFAIGGCTTTAVRAALAVSIDRAQPHLTGPVRARRIACPQATIANPAARIDLALGAALDRWQGSAQVAAGLSGTPAVGVERWQGNVGFAGTARDTRGTLDLAAAGLRASGGTASRVSARGDYVLAAAPRFAGTVGMSGGALAPYWRASLAEWGGQGAGTPVAPLAAALSRALVAATRGITAEAGIIAARDELRIERATIATDGGVRAQLGPGAGIAIGPDGVAVTGRIGVAGGGLPTMQVALAQQAPDAPITGRAEVAPFTAGAARMALSPAEFVIAPGGAFRLQTRATLSGPLGDGRVEQLTLPLAVRRTAGGVLTVNPGCTPLGFAGLSIAGLALDPTRLRLCATGPALVTATRAGVSGGARLPATILTGRLGGSPLELAAAGSTIRLADRGFAIEDVRALIGAPERRTLIAADRLTGTIAGSTVTGRFAGANGQIANVPLLMSAGEGDWRLAGGTLSLAGALRVADAQTTSPRFRPVDARAVALTVRGGAITAGGVLHEPTTGTKVADVAITHDLGAGRGQADLTVPALTFGSGFQPDLLTPLTFGVVADVKGRIDGSGRILWSPERVMSTGDFGSAAGTPGIDLAAAFGPVEGIVGRVRFDDLLGLHTPPGQTAAVRSVNPGIAVQDGTVRYQLLGGTRVQVEGAEWPFAGGSLTLDPSLLDFDSARERRLTFHVAGARADQFLQQFDFDNLNATGTFDGTLPMIFDESGGRIEGGTLAMRPGGGTIAYVGPLGQEQLGTWGNFAFQALRSLRYRTMTVAMSGPLAGEMVTDVRFAGVSQGEGAKSNFLIRRLQRLPLIFNLRIRAPFRGLIDSAASFYDPRRLIQRNLPTLLEEQNRRTAPPATTPSIQPPASETVR